MASTCCFVQYTAWVGQGAQKGTGGSFSISLQPRGADGRGQDCLGGEPAGLF
jgi:hypothetical protein